VKLRRRQVEMAMQYCPGVVDSVYDYVLSLGYDQDRVRAAKEAAETTEGEHISKEKKALFARKQAKKDATKAQAA